MNNLIEEISQISLSFGEKSLNEKIHDLSLFTPFLTKGVEKTLSSLKVDGSLSQPLPFIKKAVLKTQALCFRIFPGLAKGRKENEAIFRTVIAILLSQETLREFLLSTERHRKQFLKAVKKAAWKWHFLEISLPPASASSWEFSLLITKLPGKKRSLLEDPSDFFLQLSLIPVDVRNSILFTLLEEMERPTLFSKLSVYGKKEEIEVTLTTEFAKTKVASITQEGEILYSFQKEKGTSSIRTLENILPGKKGVVNQRRVFTETGELLGTYCGEILTFHNVLEQLIFFENPEEKTPLYLLKRQEEKKECYLFISLFSWKEWEEFLLEHRSLEGVLGYSFQGKSLEILHYNIPFDAFNKYPAPSEISAHMRDFREECLMTLTAKTFDKLGLLISEEFIFCLQAIRPDGEAFAIKERRRLEGIDRFRKIKQRLSLLLPIDHLPAQALQILLRDNIHLKGIDEYLYLKFLARWLLLKTTTNCKSSLDRCAGADAIDKAQYAFSKVTDHPFFPDTATKEEISLFKLLYSLYLTWEEPEITSGLSSGFIGEKFHRNFFQRNPETTFYLIDWLKKHPEHYLGLSDFRN